MVSIDFWDTIVSAKSGNDKRKLARRNALRDVARQHDIDLSSEDMGRAVQFISEKFDHIWLNYHRTLTPNHLVTYLFEYLDIPFAPNEHHHLVTVFEESFWEAPPRIAEEAKDIIPLLAEKYPLALISDTMFAPGRVIRNFLEDEGLGECFECFIFSDECGFSKPNPNIFYTALQSTDSIASESYHIGDLIETDIIGAQNVGMQAILFTHFAEKAYSIDEKPDHICKHWSEVDTFLLSKP